MSAHQLDALSAPWSQHRFAAPPPPGPTSFEALATWPVSSLRLTGTSSWAHSLVQPWGSSELLPQAPPPPTSLWSVLGLSPP